MNRQKKPQQKWHGPCIYKIREVTSPLHHERRGFRMLVAVPNMNGHKPFSDELAPSFAKSYMLFQSSDYQQEEVETKTKQHIQWLLNRGFTTVEHADVYTARQLVEMAKNKPHHHSLNDNDDNDEDQDFEEAA